MRPSTRKNYATARSDPSHSILEAAILTAYGEPPILLSRAQALYAAHNLRIDSVGLGDADDLGGRLAVRVDLHAVTHIEHLIHLTPRCVRALLDEPENRRNRKHVILNHMQIVHEVHDLRLTAAAAMNHSVDTAPQSP